MGGTLRSTISPPGASETSLVVDFHYHLFAEDLVPEPFRRMLAGFIKAMARGQGEDIPEAEIATKILPSMWDREGEQAIRSMDPDGVALSVLLPVDHGALMGDAPTDIWTYNELVATVAREHSDRLVAFCAVEPHRHDALELLTKAVEHWGAKGLKLVPNRSFALDEDCVMPLLRKLSDWRLPVLAHTGQWPGYGGGNFCHPMHLERMLRELPSLPVVAAHISGHWWRDLIDLAARYDNLMCDISGLQPGIIQNRARCCYVLRRVLDAFGPRRVLFASDGPAMDFLMPRADWVRAISELPETAPQGIPFAREEIRAVMYENAKRLLGLSDD